MKTRITFNSETEGDDYKLKQCIKASDMAVILWEMNTNVKRSLLKHTEVSQEYELGVNSVFDRLYDLLEAYNINTDELCI